MEPLCKVGDKFWFKDCKEFSILYDSPWVENQEFRSYIDIYTYRPFYVNEVREIEQVEELASENAYKETKIDEDTTIIESTRKYKKRKTYKYYLSPKEEWSGGYCRRGDFSGKSFEYPVLEQNKMQELIDKQDIIQKIIEGG